MRFNMISQNYTASSFETHQRVDESLTSLAMYFRNWHIFREYMNNIPC